MSIIAASRAEEGLVLSRSEIDVILERSLIYKRDIFQRKLLFGTQTLFWQNHNKNIFHFKTLIFAFKG